MAEIIAIDVTPYPIILGESEVLIEVAAPESERIKGAIVGPGDPIDLRFERRESHWYARPSIPEETKPGMWTVFVEDGEDSLELDVPIESERDKIRSKAELSVDKDKAEYGEPLVFNGLLFGPPDDLRAGQEVVLVFREAGTDIWEEIITLPTDRDGRFLVSVPAEFSGSWLVKFDGLEAGEFNQPVMALRSAPMMVEVFATPQAKIVVADFDVDKVTGSAGRDYTLSGATRPTASAFGNAVIKAHVRFKFRKGAGQDLGPPYVDRIADQDGSFREPRNIDKSGTWRVRVWPKAGGTKSPWHPHSKPIKMT